MNRIPGLLLALVIAVAGGWSAEFIGVTLMGLPKSPVSGIMMPLVSDSAAMPPSEGPVM